MAIDVNQTYCDHFAMYTNNELLCKTLGTIIMLYVNYTSVRKKSNAT